MLAHLRALIPGQRSTKLLRERDHRLCDRIAHSPGAVSRECWAVLFSRLASMPRKRWQMKQYCKSCCSLDQCSYRGTGESKNEISFPMTRYGAILDYSR